MRVLPLMSSPVVEPAEKLPLFREWAYDFNNERLLVVDGRTQLLSGQEALKVWISKALRTPLAVFAAYSADYGSEVHSLFGDAYSEGYIKSEVQRMVSEALLASPYILGVGPLSVALDGDTLTVCGEVSTVYGDTDLEVMM